jgi:hypothetical protein
MSRYKIWDKKEDIYTLGVDQNGKAQFTADEYIKTRAPWAANPNIKVIIGGGNINGTVFMEFDATKDMYKKLGATWADNATDDEILSAIEKWEDESQVSKVASPEERIAAALEYRNLSTMQDATAATDTASGDTIARNYSRGLWTAEMVKLATQKGVISTQQESTIIK